VRTTGNPFAHAVLRGAVDAHGRNIPNYHYEDLIAVKDEYNARNLRNPAVVIDTNHSNSRKIFSEQPRIAREVLQSRKYESSLREMIKGFMIESYLVEGCQGIGGNVFGRSITDACLGWDETERLIYYIAGNK
jgi:3-deoxy-7-phosphoheptulonate synthase